jgi:hypothetical protein
LAIFFPLIFTQPSHGEYGLEHIPLLTSSHESVSGLHRIRFFEEFEVTRMRYLSHFSQEILDVDAQHSFGGRSHGITSGYGPEFGNRYGTPGFYQPPRSLSTHPERVGLLPTQEETPNFFLNEFNKVLERLTADEDVADKNNLSACE